MSEKTLEETAKELLSKKGRVKGEVFRTHAIHIVYKEGEGALKKVEDRMAEIGVLMKFEEVSPNEWVDESISALVILAAKDVFNWTEDDVFEMGRAAPKVSFIIKMLVRHLVSIRKIFNMASYYWDKHFDFGSLETVELNEREGHAVLRVKGYDTHPTLCNFHAGYFQGVLELVVRGDIKIEERKCTHRGDPYNEYLMKWKSENK